MNGLPVGILGVGHYVPPTIVTNQELESEIDTSDDWIRSRTGIAARRRAEPGVATSDLGTQAALCALADAGVAPEDLDLIVVGTMTPDSAMPATSCLIQEKLGAFQAGAFDINIACSGFAYALATGAQFVATGVARRVLVVGADVMTRMMNWKDRTTCVLFGDGAGAVVLGEVQPGFGILSCYLGADGRGAPYLRVPAGGSRTPHHTPGVPLEDYYLQMDGKEVYRFAVQVMGQAAIQAIEKAGLKVEDVALLIPHQANTRIIEAARKRLGLSPERVFINLQHYGNTSCGSIPLALSEARQQGKVQPGDVVVLVGFGGGLSWGALVVRWGGTGKE